MTTRVRVSNLEKGSAHAVVVTVGHYHPSTNPPIPQRINPGEELEFTVSDDAFLTVKEANGLNDQVTKS